MLAGVFQRGWGWAVVGAIAIVLAAMYMLRLISAVLHQDVGPAVSDAALDLRRAELAILVPLVAFLLVLSAWPDAIIGALVRVDRGDASRPSRHRRSRAREQRLDVSRAAMLMAIDTPSVDWFALSPTLALLGAAGAAAARRRARAAATSRQAGRGDRLRRRLRRPRSCSRSSLSDQSPDGGTAIVADSIFRDRWAAVAQILVAACGLLAVADLVRRALARRARRPSTTRCSPRPAPAWRSSSRRRT